MADEGADAACDHLFWTLSEHSETDPERLRHLVNKLPDRTATALHQRSLLALKCEGAAVTVAINGVVAELERASLQEGQTHLVVPKLDGGSADNSAACSIGTASASEKDTSQSAALKTSTAQGKPLGTPGQHEHLLQPNGWQAMLEPQQTPAHSTLLDMLPDSHPHKVGGSTAAAAAGEARHAAPSSWHGSHHSAQPPSAASMVPQLAELSLRDAAEAAATHQLPQGHGATVAAPDAIKQGASTANKMHAGGLGSGASSQPLFNRVASEPRFPAPPHPQHSPPPPHAMPGPLGNRGIPHSQPNQHPGVMPGMLQYNARPSSGVSLPDMPIHSSMPMQRPMHTPLPSAQPQGPLPQYNPNTLQQIVSNLQSNPHMPTPYGMPHPSQALQMPMQQQHAQQMAAHNGGAVSAMQNRPSIPTWCVVTGLPRATLPPQVPPEGVLNITHLLPWPQAVRDMLQMGLLGVTLDPTVRENRGHIDQPSLMLMVTQPAESGTLLQGLTYREMYMGRQNLPEPWRMPQRWESDSAEMALEDLDKVRLVLSFRGLNLLSNSYEPFFICVQSALMVLCNAPSDQYSAIEESGVGKLLWEFMRTSMDCLQRMADAKQHTARASDSRGGSSEPMRGGWLQRLNHEKQKLALMIDWHDRQQPDLTWVSTLLINGKPINVSEACVKKQDARDCAARTYLISIGIHGHD